MNLGPIDRALADILDHPAGQELILVGGAAILIRLETLQANPRETVLEAIPAARATEDLDFLISLDMFVRRERGEEVRRMLEELEYEDRDRFWQFEKEEHSVDLLARRPEDHHNLVSHGRRVKAKPSIALHGRETPEAFAAELKPQSVVIAFDDRDRTALVGHPYGLVNMKVRAAHDRHVKQKAGEPPKRFSEKHVLDVYRIVASMTLAEVTEAGALAKEYQTNEIAVEIRAEARVLFDRSDTRAFLEAQNQANIQLDHATFRDALFEVLG